MFLAGVGFLLLVIVLFQLSRQLYRQIWLFFYHLIGHKNMAIRLLLVVLLPGTIVHELSHFVAAVFVGVRTGTINLMPKIKDSGEVIAGETQIAQCDPIRYSIIGVAPFLAGVGIIYAINKFWLFASINSVVNIGQITTPFIQFGWLTLFFLVVLVWVSNTMFSSRKDLEFMFIPLILLYVVGFVVYFSGFKVELSREIYDQLTVFLRELDIFLLLTVLINTALWLTVRALNNLVFRLAKSK